MIFRTLLTAVVGGLLLISCGRESSMTSLTFSGICDGSAAVRINRQHLLVAYDENRSLYAYANSGGAPIGVYPLGDLLGQTEDKETDIEAATITQNGIWWIGSHSRDSKGRTAPNRQVLFKTNIPNESSGLALLSKVHNLDSLIVGVVGATAAELAPKEGGISIEAMSATRDGDLLIGLRSPLSAGEATILKLVATDTGFKLDHTYKLDLKKRGVRDLIPDGGQYLLIAGDTGNGGTHSVYRWNPASNKLHEVITLPEQFNAEALVNFGEYVLVLSDDGKVQRPDNTASDGSRICDRIFQNNNAHSSVFFRGLKLTGG